MPQKRLRWVNLSKREVKSKLALSSKPWTKCVLSDMETLKVQAKEILGTKSKKREQEARILCT
jgi:hypothetical protein